MNLVETVYLLTRKFPKQETYALANQIQRAAVSIPSNIAEGHTRERIKEYLHHLSMAQGARDATRDIDALEIPPPTTIERGNDRYSFAWATTLRPSKLSHKQVTPPDVRPTPDTRHPTPILSMEG